MRLSILLLLVAGFASSAPAVDRADLDYRIRKLTLKLEAMQAKPDKRIPAHYLRDAKGIVLLDRTKAGFLFAYQGGSGVVLARDPKSGQWSPPAFVTANEASLGFQIGGQQSFVVILLMNTNAVQMFAAGNFKLAGEAAGTAGDVSRGVEGSISSTEPWMLVFTDREGLYGGAAVKGDALAPDTNADVAYYSQYLSMNEIFYGRKVTASQAALDLARGLDRFAR